MNLVDCINANVLLPYAERMVAHHMRLPPDDSRVFPTTLDLLKTL